MHWLLRFDPVLLSLFSPDEEDVAPPEAEDDVDFKDVLFLNLQRNIIPTRETSIRNSVTYSLVQTNLSCVLRWKWKHLYRQNVLQYCIRHEEILTRWGLYDIWIDTYITVK